MDRERRQAFSIFASRLLGQQVLQAYQKSEARKQSLRAYHITHGAQVPRFLIDLLRSSMTIIEPGQITIDYTVPINTGGAFCDLLCGQHPELGKVALKRLRSDLAGSGRFPVRSVVDLSYLVS